MTENFIALVLTAGICIILPLVVIGILIIRNKTERKGILLLFLTGAAIYISMQWGVKVHGLNVLAIHTGLPSFINAHYIPYIFLVALAGAILNVLPEGLVLRYAMKNKMTFKKAIAFGMGYGMAESTMLVGYQNLKTIIHWIMGNDIDLETNTIELFLSGYERILIMLIDIAIVIVFAYFINQSAFVKGGIISIFCQTMLAFLPGFFIAFTLKNYYEVYDRSLALILIYVVLTMAGITAGVVLNNLKYSFS